MTEPKRGTSRKGIKHRQPRVTTQAVRDAVRRRMQWLKPFTKRGDQMPPKSCDHGGDHERP